MQVAQWKQEIANARLNLPSLIKRANDIAISGEVINPQEVEEIVINSQSNAEEFIKIATRDEIVFRPNVDGFIDNLRTQKYAESTINSYSHDLEFFLLKFTKLSELTTRAVRDWIKVLRANGKTDGSIVRVLAKSVTKFLKYLEYKFDLVINVDLSVPKFDTVPSAITNRKDIDNDGLGVLYQQAIKDRDTEIKHFLFIASYTGMRINEIGDLKVSSIKIVDGVKVIDIEKSKTKAGVRKIPVSRWLEDLLTELCKNKNQDDYLFDIPRDVKRPTGAVVNRFSKMKSSLNFGDDITFHSTRHAVDTMLLRAGVDSKIVSQLMGHAIKGNESTKTYYQGAHLKQLKEAIDIINWPSLQTMSLLPFFE